MLRYWGVQRWDRGVGTAISRCSSWGQGCEHGALQVCPLTQLVCTSSPSHHPQRKRGPTFPFLHPITPASSSATRRSHATDTFHLRSPQPPADINELITQIAQLALRQARSRRFSEFRMEKSVCFLPFLNLQMLLSWHFPESTCSHFQHRVLFPWIPAHAPYARLSCHVLVLVLVLVLVPARGTPALNPVPPPWHLSWVCLYSTRQTKSL